MGNNQHKILNIALSVLLAAQTKTNAQLIDINQNLFSAAHQLISIGLEYDQVDKVITNGCWCTKFNPTLEQSNYGGPIIKNDLDQICKNWITARHCIESYEGGSCYNNWVLDGEIYSVNYQHLVTGKTNKVCKNNDFEDCKFDSCRIDTSFLEQIKEFLMKNPLFEGETEENCHSWEESVSSGKGGKGSGSKNNNSGSGLSETVVNHDNKICAGEVPDVYVTTPDQTTTTTTTTTTTASTTTTTLPFQGKTYSEDAVQNTCKDSKFDLTILIDGSGSINEHDFDVAIDWTKRFLSPLDIGEDHTRVSIAQFSFFTKLYSLVQSDRSVLNSVLDYLSNDQYKHGTLTNVALHAMLEVIKAYGRPEVPQVLLMLTDGQSNRGLSLDLGNGPVNTADELHNNNVQVFSIGVGNATSQEELEHIATDPDDIHLYEVDNYESLEDIRLMIAQKVCEYYESQPRQSGRSLGARRPTMANVGGIERKEIPNFENMPIFKLDDDLVDEGDFLDA